MRLVRPELREPDLPRTAKVRDRALRTGWTTGACAAAAAKAAATVLAGRPAPRSVEIPLPEPYAGGDGLVAPPGLHAGGRRATLPVERTAAGAGWAEAVVVKDAGDDPDCTDGAHLVVRLAPTGDPGIAFHGGAGVGTVTKPGLGLPVGGPAINGMPREMIAAAVAEVRAPLGLACTISVPGGERMAAKTTNRRLGIVGGISILGTTGVVRPFSTASWRASVVQAVDVMAAGGAATVVLATGGRTERAAMRLLPELPEACFVEVGDFTGAALARAAERAIPRGVFVGMAGKLTKLAAGVMMTHYTRSKVDLSLLACLTADAGGGAELAGAVERANTGRHAYELWRDAGLAGPVGDLLCERVAANLTRFTGGRVICDAVLVDFDTLEPVAASAGWRAQP
ncbi:MAG TPA: cobalt-precorrin-5B (C(1))-methyltransferase [Egibacteraceae bacterium]|nr:cobalt-precorrin-5B (C(1))-methyltransferase [Egibacteraceae bacterium]